MLTSGTIRIAPFYQTGILLPDARLIRRTGKCGSIAQQEWIRKALKVFFIWQRRKNWVWF